MATIDKQSEDQNLIPSKTNDAKDINIWTNSEFQTSPTKKRGFYVENNAAKFPSLSSNNTTTNTTLGSKTLASAPVKPPPRPGKKTFLNSVLTILSKSTAGTQYPDEDDPKPKTKSKRKPRNEDQTTKRESRKKKYRSKILNETKPFEDPLEVIQGKKDIVYSTSFSSIASNAEDKPKELDCPRLFKDREEYQTILKEIENGRNIEKKESISKANDKNVYNFFVDLIETTFSMYNVNPNNKELTDNLSAASSKVAFEIDEAVAKKLTVPKPRYSPPVSRIASNIFYPEYDDRILLDNFYNAPFRTNYLLGTDTKAEKRKKSNNKKKMIPPWSKKEPAKPVSLKKNKLDFINMVKEQLTMDYYTYQEPQNLFDALRGMAYSKKKQRTIRFDDLSTPLERRNPPKGKTKKTKKSAKTNKREKDHPKTIKPQDTKKYQPPPPEVEDFAAEYLASGIDSNLSIEVYGYELDPNHQKLRQMNKVTLPYHSSDSSSSGTLTMTDPIF